MPHTSTPKLCRHRSQHQGYVTLNGREHYLGDWPTYCGKKPPSDVRARYDELIAKWLANGRQLPDERPPLTVNEVLLAYLKWAETRTFPNEKRTIRTVSSVTPRASCGNSSGELQRPSLAPKLRAVQQAMAERGWCRNTVNAQIDRVRRMFKWAVGEELVPGTVYHALRAVESVRRGTPGVRDTQPVKPVPLETVETVLPYLTQTMRVMVQVQLLTGVRPGELCQLRAADIDLSGEGGVWLYRPRQHKTQHHGHERVVVIGPRAQELLRPYIDAGHEYLFSPRAAEDLRNTQRRANRKSPMTPSQAAHKPKTSPKRPKRERYDETSYRNAIYRACDRAIPPTGALARLPNESMREWRTRLSDDDRAAMTRWRAEHRWHPNRLRHTAATFIRREHGIEATRIILGHAKLTTSEIYAEADQRKAIDVMKRVG